MILPLSFDDTNTFKADIPKDPLRKQFNITMSTDELTCNQPCRTFRPMD